MAHAATDDLWMLEIRLFNLKPGTGSEFYRVADEGTVPLMRRFGIHVLGYYQSTTNPDAFFLVRAFRDAEDRKEVSEVFYASPEWLAYEDTVMGMVSDYHMVTTTVTGENLDKLSGMAAS